MHSSCLREKKGELRSLELTVILQVHGGCSQKGSEHLEENEERELFPGVSAQNAQAEGHSRVQVGAFRERRELLSYSVTQDADSNEREQELHLVSPETPRDTNTPNVTPSEKPKLIDRYWPFFSWLVVTWATEPHPKSCNEAREGPG